MSTPYTTAWARRVLVAVHVVVVAVPVVLIILRNPGGPSVRDAVLPVALGVAIGAVALRHSQATARGIRPRGAAWTLLALAVLVYLPLPWFGLSWGITQTALIASCLMLLPGRAGVIGAVLVLLVAGTVAADALREIASTARFLYNVGGGVLLDATVGVAIYGAARLVRVLDELDSARTELAELAVGRERLRVSRDLHDLLGQSLSAVSLKGDLAIRLLHRDPPGARAEIESLTGVARDALRGVRAITHNEHTVSLRTETDGGAALLDAAGVRTHIDVNMSRLRAPVEDVLAWAVREGVTNVLRHSRAATCTIRAGRRDAMDWLEIVNDGAGSSSGAGHGLDGLAERARALSGSVSAARLPDGTFRLFVEIPEESAVIEEARE